MQRIAALFLTGFLALVGFAAPGAADLLEAYDLVMTDPEADAMNYLAPGVHVSDLGGVTRLSTEKQDITSLEMATEADILQVKLNTMSFYGGTSSLMYVVHFTIGDTRYYTCWNIQSAGLTSQYQDIGEDMQLGCTKFNLNGDQTRVGPATREGGIDAPTSGDSFYIRWEVPKGEIGDPADGVALTDVVAETWNRGLNTDNAPNTSPQSDYVWNMADRAPDEGVAEYVLGGGPGAVELNLTVSSAEQAVGAGSVVPFALNTTLVGDGEANVTYSVEGLPEGWEARFSPEGASLNSTANQTASSLQILVDPAAENGTYALTVIASAPLANASASANVTITIDRSLQASGPDGEEPLFEPTPTPDEDGNGTTPGNGTALEDEDGGMLPAPGFAAAALVGLGAALVLRRRRA